MIRLSGKRTARAGTEVCIDAISIGIGLSVHVEVNGKKIPFDLSIDKKADTAVICFKMPPREKGGVLITATNSSGGRGATHAVVSL